MLPRRLVASMFILALGGTAAHSASVDSLDSELSLSALMDLDVESISKRAEPMLWAPSAIYVLTAADLRAHGVRRIQDALRLAPGVFLAEKDWNNAYYNIREQKSPKPQTVNILVDGVPQYDPIHGGTLLRDLDIPVDLIDRIEFIRGPGGTVYGANSVTGIVSIFTKKPGPTPSWGARGGSSWPGNHDGNAWGTRALGPVRMLAWAGGGRYSGYAPEDRYDGDTLDIFVPGKTGRSQTGAPTTWNDTTFRVANLFPDQDIARTDRWNAGLGAAWTSGIATWTARLRGNGSYGKTYRYHLGGYRTEAEATRLALLALGYGNPDSLLSLYGPSGVAAALPSGQLGAFHGLKAANAASPNQIMVEDIHYTQLTGSVRTDLAFDEGHSAFVNLYGLTRDIRDVTYTRDHNIYEIEAQDVLTTPLWGSPFDLEWITGANWRIVQYRLGTYSEAARERFLQPEAVEHLYAGFVQGKLSWNRLVDLVAGVKGEVWTLVDDAPNWSPSARVAFHPTENWNLWGAVSRAVTVPGYGQTRSELPVFQMVPSWALPPNASVPLPGYWRTVAQSDPKAASYVNWEAGTRGMLARWASLDVTSYFTRFEDRIGQSRTSTTLVASRAHPGDSIVPLYYQNMDDGAFWGVEGILKLLPTRKSSLELGYTWSQLEVYSSADAVRVGRSHTNPEHQVKSRLEYELPWAIQAGTSATWYSSYRTEQKGYDYVRQLTTDAIDPSGTARTSTFFGRVASRVRWDLDLEAPLGSSHLFLQAWAHDILAWDRPLEEFGYVGIMKPQAVSPDIGGALRAAF